MAEDLPLRPRRGGHRPPAKTVVILVEGRSEKVYFERFRTRERPIAIRIHESKDSTAEGMVEKCIGLNERSGLDTKTDDAAVVFDADINSREDIGRAVETATGRGIKVYVSNPSFEFWLLLHFEDNRVNEVQGVIEELLGKHIGVRYKKSEGVNRHITDKNVKEAIIRSRRLLPSGDPVDCKDRSPSTCLHALVEEIMGDK
ncbi:MAG: RloB family protein [Methanomassiliicoccaceae archaeon]|nr:RloB family protein [Methanomassiliicoccaceae archaeon]